MQQGMVSFNSDVGQAEWFDVCRQEMLRFPAGLHDDQVDALSQLLAWVQQQYRYEEVGVGAPIYADDPRFR